jgi:hypothetical protein
MSSGNVAGQQIFVLLRRRYVAECTAEGIMVTQPLPLLLILSIFGAIADWRYKRAGGKPSSRRDRILFWSVVLVVAVPIFVVEIIGADPRGILGFVVVPLALWLFFAWELGRWRMRRKYPLPPKTDAAAAGK